MGVGRLTDFYNVRHANDLQVESLDVVPVATRWPTDRFEAAAKAPPPRIRAGASVLELGAGDGRLAESLRIGGVDFESSSILELSEIRLEGLRHHLVDRRYRFLHGDAEAVLDSTSGPYDVVIMLALIEHLVDPPGAMRQIRTLLAPVGFVYIETPNIAKWTRHMRLTIGGSPSMFGEVELVAYA